MLQGFSFSEKETAQSQQHRYALGSFLLNSGQLYVFRESCFLELGARNKREARKARVSPFVGKNRIPRTLHGAKFSFLQSLNFGAVAETRIFALIVKAPRASLTSPHPTVSLRSTSSRARYLQLSRIYF